MRRGLALLLGTGLLAACGPQEPAPVNSTGQQVGAASGNPLEQAAIAAGLVSDVQSLSPIGLYRQRHEVGRDSLCIVPSRGEGEAKADTALNFGLEANFGENIGCRGRGTLRVAGDKLILNFNRSACLIVARYDGDRVVLPGTLDTECRKLCSERGSLEGISFPRVSRDASVAATAEASAGGRLCPSSGI